MCDRGNETFLRIDMRVSGGMGPGWEEEGDDRGKDLEDSFTED